MKGIEYDNDLAREIIRTLLYFDIFNYPLNAQEVFNYLQVNSTTQSEVMRCLDNLAEQKDLFRFGDLYSLRADDKNIKRRIRGNREAERWLKVAQKQARFIASFPYVRAVMASGSLSKGYMDENSDLDFFIVTTPGRLWIARTLLVVYKRIFLFNSYKRFCVNYFVDSRHLEIEEKNIFTATELVTLLPLHNHAYYRALLTSNRWLRDFLPNSRPRRSQGIGEQPSPFVRRVSEFILNPFARPLNKFFMRMTLRRWKKLYVGKFNKEDFEIAFKTLPHASKNHPNYYQKKVLDLYQRKIIERARQFEQ